MAHLLLLAVQWSQSPIQMDAESAALMHVCPSCDWRCSFCRFDPFWNTLIVAGIEPDGSSFCGAVSQLGVQYSDTCVCSGFASHLALPLLRQHQSAEMPLSDAKALMKEALKVGVDSA